MNRWLALSLCLVLVGGVTTACFSRDDDPPSRPSVADDADGLADENGGPEDKLTPGDDAPASDADAAADSVAADGPTPTADPTVVALARDFKPPVKGDPEAPVMIYEFADFL